MDLKQKIINRANQLQQEAAIGSTDDKRKNREKAAKDWLEKFYAVLEFIDGLDPDEDMGIDNLTKLLADSWESKEHDKDVVIKQKIKALKNAA